MISATEDKQHISPQCILIQLHGSRTTSLENSKSSSLILPSLSSLTVGDSLWCKRIVIITRSEDIEDGREIFKSLRKLNLELWEQKALNGLQY